MMSIDGEPRGEKTETSATMERPEGSGVTTPRRATGTRLALGSLAALLIVAGAIYYFADHRGGSEVTTGSRSERPAESPTVASSPRAADGAEKPASSTTTSQEAPTAQPQSPQPGEPRQSADATPPAATNPAETPATPPTATPTPPATTATPPATIATSPETPTAPPPPIAQDSAAKSQAAENERSSDAAKTIPTTDPGAATRADAPPPSSMRDQPAALPDQAAATPKKENVLVVMRGPANIRSAPGKNGRVVGTAPKNATVKELDRSGNWVQVESEAGTGWINAALLSAPESR